jgi:hypothetical protein
MPYAESAFSFIETRLFTRLVQKYLDDDEYRELLAYANFAGARRDERSVVVIG